MASLTGNPSILSQPAWLEVPFQIRGKTHLDSLIDPMLAGHRLQLAADFRDADNDAATALPRVQQPSLPVASWEGKGWKDNDISTSQRMMKILSNAQRLHSRIKPGASPQMMQDASCSMLDDAERLLVDSSISYRMALQCVFVIHMVSLIALCAEQRLRAIALFKHWHGRLTL